MINAKITTLILTTLILTSCSNSVKKWSCRNTESQFCGTISEADKAYSSKPNYNEALEVEKADSNKYSSFADVNNKRLIRSGDKIGRVWVAPYKDSNDNWHEESYVQVVDEPGKWEIVKKEIIVKDYKLEEENFEALEEYHEISLKDEKEEE